MNIDWTPGVLNALARTPEMAALLNRAAEKVADQARTNAAAHYPGSTRPLGIDTATGVDARSAYADVGYTRTHPGFVLWWSEVGTQRMAPRPHLRRALAQVSL